MSHLQRFHLSGLLPFMFVMFECIAFETFVKKTPKKLTTTTTTKKKLRHVQA